MNNKREIIWNKFMKIDLISKLEVLKLIDELNNMELTYRGCVFYEFAEYDLERYFAECGISEIVDKMRNSDIKNEDKYFYANPNRTHSLIGCSEKFIESQIDKNKELIINMIDPYIAEIKGDLGIDFRSYHESIRVGDYLSLEDGKGDYYLTQILKTKNGYVLMDVDTFEIEEKIFNNLTEINNFISETNATPYYVDYVNGTEIPDDELTDNLYSYLVYDKDCGGDFEVVITYDGMNDMYDIMNSTLDDIFYEDEFESFGDAIIKLIEDFSIVKRLRN